MEEKGQDNILEVDIVSPQEGVNITEETSIEGFKNVFTGEKYNTEREAVDSYDALNKEFITIDDIRSDFGRMSNPNEVRVLQKELSSLMPNLDLEINGVFDLKTERAIRQYENLIQSMGAY